MKLNQSLTNLIIEIKVDTQFYIKTTPPFTNKDKEQKNCQNQDHKTSLTDFILASVFVTRFIMINPFSPSANDMYSERPA